MRAFVAIRLEESVIAGLVRWQQRLAARVPGVRWTKAKQIHLTLKFLGEVPGERLPESIAALGRAVSNTGPFELSVADLGAFPSLDRPNIVWAGLRGNLGALASLQQRVDAETPELAEHEEKHPFHPHLTLGRLKDFRLKQRAGKALGEMRFEPLPPWTVRRIELMQSELRPQGPVYSTLSSCPFVS